MAFRYTPQIFSYVGRVLAFVGHGYDSPFYLLGCMLAFVVHGRFIGWIRKLLGKF